MNMGLTGGIATGKSTVSRLLTERGAALVDADKIAREVVEPGQAPLRLIAERFGQAVLLENGALNRKKLGEIVFSDPAERRALEQIMHPAIRSLMKERMAQLEQEDPNRLVVVDVPLLYESDLSSLFHKVMVVYVPREIQAARLMERDGLTFEAAKRRLDAQMDIEEKRIRADYVIDNGGSLVETIRRVDDFWRENGRL